MAAASPRQFLFFYTSLLFVPLLLIHAPGRCTCLSFSFNFSASTSTSDPCDTELRCERDAHLGPSGVLELTKNEIKSDILSVGRASYAHPVPLWDTTTGELASFTTTFSFQIKPKNETFISRCNESGDGTAFFVSPYPSRIPPNSYGWNLALFNESNNRFATGDSRVVAVEFDTFLNVDWDKTRDHVGIDVSSIDSEAFVNVTEGLVSQDAIMAANISYDNLTGMLGAVLRIDGGQPHEVSTKVDMKGNLPEQVAVGFSAATGICSDLHQVLSWSFSFTLEPPSSSKANTGDHRRLLLLVPTVVATFLVFVCATVVAIGCLVRRRRAWKNLQRIANGDDSDAEHEEAEFERGVGPRRYRYHELATATSNFADEEKLGRGGFGNVYRGKLGDQDRPVAIKMFSAGGESAAAQAMRKAFEAEVRIISRLRHRHLVQLLGWCDSRKGLLLVYELVPQGSLDRHLYSTSSLLPWSERYNIILGLGSALRYLHTEWDQCVLHGDIKPSNILLGSSHGTKLGDFGLARLVDHGAGPRTTQVVMGTAGYIDPEFIRSRRPSTESDVHSFGVVLLEIVTGRRPEMEHPDKVISLLEWVWGLYDTNALLDAADEKVTAGGREWQVHRVLVVGLWCAHPDPGARPAIAQAMNVLQSEDVALPILSRRVYNTSDDPPAAAENVPGDDVSSWVLSGGR